MGAPVPVETVATADSVILLDDEIEGKIMASSDYSFRKIGSEVPVLSDEASLFDPLCPPSKPLAVSERFRLLFVAHPKGFCVTKTADVMTAAEKVEVEGKCSSIQEFSLVDVPLENVSMLSLSSDDALLAASVTNEVHFFAVSALLHKEQKPSFSISLDDFISIKDVCWSKILAKEYLILSADGKLYHGSGQGPLNLVAEGVDCASWSSQENIAAVAKKNVVSILSPKFKEKLQFVLPFQSITNGNDVTQAIKVDLIEWIKPDCIAVGCFHSYDDGDRSCIFQVISSNTGNIKDVTESSKPIVESFNDVYLDPCSDLPAQTGSHLFLGYLDQYGVAFITNLNVSRQVGLMGWFLDNGKKEAAIVDIQNDSWNMQINYEENENNVIVGLAVDKFSQNVNARLKIGSEEKDVAPCCVIASLTVDGKISVFHFASATGVLPSQEVFSHVDNDDNVPPLTKPQISSSLGDGNVEPAISVSERAELKTAEPDRIGSKTTKFDNAEISSGLTSSLGGSNALSEAAITPSKMQSSRGVLQHSENVKEKTKFPTGSNSFGLNASTYPSSQGPFDRSAISKRPFQHESSKELAATSFPSKHPHSTLHASRHIGNAEEMMRALDGLLEDIEVKDGFIDSSISSQISPVMELEESMWALSERCRIYKGVMDEKLKDVKHLLDKTVQVMTRKANIEGMLKQSTDGRYWDLWDRQKLSYQMELKRKSISEYEQLLTNKLVELERHFNTLELNKFGENGESPKNQTLLRNPSSHLRQMKSVQSLRNTMNAQLDAAEHLSVCLAEQMASLRIVESSEKHDMKRQIFESVGLSYPDPSPPPPSNRTSSFPSPGGRLLLASSSFASDGTPAKNRVVSEQETARRRQRYSLDHSWTSIEPPKATVKRMSKKDHEKKSSENPNPQKKSELGRGSLSRHFENRGRQEVPGETNESGFGSLNRREEAGFPDFGIKTSSTGMTLPSSTSEAEAARRRDPMILHSTDRSSSRGKSEEYILGQKPTNLFRASLGSGAEEKEMLTSTPQLFPSLSSSSSSSLSSGNRTAGFGASLLPKAFTSGVSPPDLSSKLSEQPPYGASKTSGEEMPMPLLQKTLASSSPKLTPEENEAPPHLQKKAPDLSPKLSSSPESFSSGQPTTSNPPPVTTIPSEKFSAPQAAAVFPVSASMEASPFAATAVVSSVADVVKKAATTAAASDDMEEMEEEAPETSSKTNSDHLSLGSFGGFGISSNPNTATATAQSTKNPFGVVSSSAAAPPPPPPFGTTAFPSYTAQGGGDLFRPASFNLPSSPSSSHQLTPLVSPGIPGQSSGMAGFGRPAAVGVGQQAIGSVLGSFGQSRQLGGGGSSVGSSGFASVPSGFGGFSAAAASNTGFGFAAAANNTGMGFAAAATASQGGFGAFSNNKQQGGNSGFGGSPPPSELFTQMRK